MFVRAVLPVVLAVAVITAGHCAEPEVPLDSSGCEWMKYWTVPMIICAGKMLDEQVKVKSGLHDEMMQVFEVTEVFYGKPDAKRVYFPTGEYGLKAGEEVLLSLRRVAAMISDTPENRRRVFEAIEKQSGKRMRYGFLDEDKIIDEGEALLRSFIKDLLLKVEGNPCAGKGGGIKLIRCEAPRGVYARFNRADDETFEEDDVHSRWIRFWLAASTENFDVDHPVRQLAQREFAGPDFCWRRHPRAQKTKELSQTLAGIGGPLAVELYIEYSAPSGDDAVGRAIREEYGKLRDKLDALNRDPPRNIERAIAQIAARYEKTREKKGPKEEGLVLFNERSPELFILGQAYDALLSPYGQKHLSEEQKKKLVPMLIELLMDRAVVHDSSAGDGPVIESHEKAYSLLVKITSKDFPEPVPDSLCNYGQRLFLMGEPDPEQTLTMEERKKRLDTWREWWKKSKED